MNDSDLNLLHAFRAGDTTAFEALFLRLYAPVYRIAYGLVHDAHLADDVAQDALLALYREPPALQHGSPLAWVCRVAINRSYNMLRSRQREEQRLARVPIMLADDADDPSLYAERSEQRARVRAVLAGLPERQAQLLVLRHAGLSYAEVADAIGVAPGSVGTLLARAEHAFSEAAGSTTSVTAHVHPPGWASRSEP